MYNVLDTVGFLIALLAIIILILKITSHAKYVRIIRGKSHNEQSIYLSGLIYVFTVVTFNMYFPILKRSQDKEAEKLRYKCNYLLIMFYVCILGTVLAFSH